MENYTRQAFERYWKDQFKLDGSSQFANWITVANLTLTTL